MTRFVRWQLRIFAFLTVVSLVIMAVWFMRVPASVGIGRYTLKVELADTGGLYTSSNVTYRGQTVGQVTSVQLANGGVEAVLSMDSGTKVPKSSIAEVHSRSAIGEQYIDLVPQSTAGPYFSDDNVIPVEQTTVPQDIAPLIDTVNKSLQQIPQDKLDVLIDESYDAVNGSEEDLRRLLDSANKLISDANGNVAAVNTLIKDLGPVLNSQVVTSDSIRTWASSLSSLSAQAADNDDALRGILKNTPDAAGQVNALFQQLQPTLPILLSNLVSLGQVGVTYNASLEQVLVIIPQGMSALAAIAVPNLDGTDRGFLSFNTPTLNSLPPCTTGFLPASERRDGSAVDSPPRTDEDLYCSIPQDSTNSVRGARNLPCMDKPGKRAPTVTMCKSDESYVPLGDNPWIGDPTPTVDNPALAQQGAPSGFRDSESAGPVATAKYDPDSGQYIAPDGSVYTQSDLADKQQTEGGATWQQMMDPAK
ncbi:MlaD family protein [Williamsia sp. DF01-3]|uniref:MCE family protein n=1 Tax=Williamsia sp. DF01-3 TaxID=2934157 RepID=UPI00248BCB74|nr:MlaD family protein [Williamsia sp. DF01-3]